MNFNFDEIICRKNTNSVKHDFAAEYGMPEDALPLWVADMDFTSPPQVIADIQKAVEHGIFGYSEAKDDYYDALCGWFGTRLGFAFSREDVVKTPGVIFALSNAVRAYTEHGQAVLIQTPVYRPFYDVVQKNGRKLVTSPLIYSDGKYSMDFDDFERKIKDNAVKLFILCSPHNPVGRVWTREELEKVATICRENDVHVISDEIHCDFIYAGNEHISFGLIDSDAVVATAPSKTFNLAGLQASNVIVRNEQLRTKLKTEISRSGYGEVNTLGMIACRSAYKNGAQWLEQLVEYLEANVRLVDEFLSEKLPKVKLVKPQGTYLLWLDFTAYGLPQKELDAMLTNGAKLWLSSGTVYGQEGEGFQRMNIGCSRKILVEALNRLEKEFKGK